MQIRHLLGACALIAAGSAAAAEYTVSGAKTGFAFDPGPPLSTKVTDTPISPTFTGTWTIDPAALSGAIRFAPYKVQVAVSFLFKAELDFPNAAYDIVGGNVSYDADTRKLTLSNAKLAYTGTAPVCSGASTICKAQPSPDLEKFNLTLTFADATLSGFEGIATGVNEAGDNGNSVYTWKFSGHRAGADVAAGQ